jgi:poly(3-hydroxybutyrate) depolymerase
MVHEVGRLISGATAAKQQLATFAVDGEITFASASSRAAFVEELSRETARLAAKYHEPQAPGGRRHRLVVALHPSLKTEPHEEIQP